jgi:hypothetical protein
MSAKLVKTLADRGCRVVGATDPHGHILRKVIKSKKNTGSCRAVIRGQSCSEKNVSHKKKKRQFTDVRSNRVRKLVHGWEVMLF